MGWRIRDVVSLTAVIGCVTTIAVALDPTVRLAGENAEMRIALQSTHTLIAAFAAYLLYGRFRRRRLLSDLCLVYALSLLAALNLFFALLPSPTDGDGSPLVFQTWAPLALRLVATIAIAVAALMGRRQVAVQRPGVAVFVAVDATLAVVAIAVAVLVNVLPPGIEVLDTTAGTPAISGHPFLIAGHLVMAAAAALATRGFLRSTRGDPLIGALAVGSMLSAFSFLCFAVYPSADTNIVQSGDALRFGFYLVLLLGAEREIARYWSQLAGVAVFEERRRLARDLHDGVAQELAYVVSQTRMLVRGSAPEGTDERIAAAAERALDESRRAITALTTTRDEPLHLAIARAAEDTAGRVGVDVTVEVSTKLIVAPAVLEALVRIVREAITNAARHGSAQNVIVGLSDEGVLHITDDGKGFTPETATPNRFGLVSMRERAEQLGARFRVESQPGMGTRVEVALR